MTTAPSPCPCSCHPRPANPGLHEGAICSCQWSQEERAARWQKVEESLAVGRQAYAEAAAIEGEQAHSEAERLDAQFVSYGGLCPLVLRLVVDGHGVYLRSRHEMFQVVVSTDPDPWKSGDGELVASGDERDLWAEGTTWVDPVLAVRATVGAVRRWMLRDCAHAGASSAFCPDCGVPLDARFGGPGVSAPAGN